MALASLGGRGRGGGRGGRHYSGYGGCVLSPLHFQWLTFPSHFLSIGPGRRAPGSSGISLMDSLSLSPICPLPLLGKQVHLSQSWKQSAWPPAKVKWDICSFPTQGMPTHTFLSQAHRDPSCLLALQDLSKEGSGHFCRAVHDFLWVLNHSSASNHKTSFLQLRKYPFFLGYIAHS